MAVFYIYSADVLGPDPKTGDFVLDADYTPSGGRFKVTVKDDDSRLNATGDNNQIAQIEDTQGNVVAEGTLTSSSYSVGLNEDNGTLYFDPIEIDGKIVGYSTSEPLNPGASYEVVGTSSWNGSYSYYEQQSVPCFAPGTLIETADGPCRVDRIAPDTRVLTRDNGLQPVLWAGAFRTRPGLQDQDARGGWPVQLPRAAGASQPLTVSAQHRVLLIDPAFHLTHDTSEVLAPAGWLSPPNPPPEGRPPVWHHLLFANHEVIRADGYWVESLFAGGTVFAGLPVAAQEAAYAALGPAALSGHGRPARPCLRRWEVAIWADRTNPCTRSRGGFAA